MNQLKQALNRQKSIGSEKAIELANSKWWLNKTDLEIVEFQLFTSEACMPFNLFNKYVENVLCRPVFWPEFVFNLGGIMDEFENIKKNATN